MDIYFVKGEVEKILTSCTDRIRSKNLITEISYEYTNDRCDECSIDDKNLDNLYANLTVKRTPDDEVGYELGFYIDCKRGVVDGAEFDNAIMELRAEAEELAEAITGAEDVDACLGEMIEKQRQATEEAKAELDAMLKDLRRKTLIGIAAGIALIVLIALAVAIF